jgi:hypothetical protein
VLDTDGDDFSGERFGLSFKAPTTDVDDTTQARLDDLGTSWRMGLNAGKEWTCWGASGKAFLQVEGDYGPKQFTYFPNAGKMAEKTLTHSYSLGVWGFIQRAELRRTPWALQLKATYASDWKEADKVGVVTDGDLTLVKKQVVIDRPTRKATAVGRVFYYRRFAPGSEFAIGPSLAMSGSGKAGKFAPSGDKLIGRMELWLYYLPLANLPNVRLGVAPFMDGYFRGKSPDERRVELGMLIQLKVGKEVFLY